MNNFSKIISIIFFIVVIQGFFPRNFTSYAITSVINNTNTNKMNSLLRVSLEPGISLNDININVFTSNTNYTLKKKQLNETSFILELSNTKLATSENINLEKVSNLISNARLVPFLNTSTTDNKKMLRIIIDSSSKDVNYNVIVKSIDSLEDKNNNSKGAKIYYPPISLSSAPQNMAFYTPIENKNLPKESLIENNTIQPPKLITSQPENNIDLNKIDNIEPPKNIGVLNSLPDIDKMIVQAPSEDSPAESTESPQPKPNIKKEETSSIETILSKDIALFLGCISGIILFGILIGIFLTIKKMKRKIEERKLPGDINLLDNATDDFKNLIEEAKKLNDSGFEITEITNTDDIKPTQDQMPDQAFNLFEDETEEVEVIENFDIKENQSIYLVKVNGHKILVGSINENINIIKVFEGPNYNNIDYFEITKEANIGGKQMFSVKLNSWQGVVKLQNNQFNLHSELSQ